MTHAHHVASKVATDLKRMQRLSHGNIPTEQDISNYQGEAAFLLEKECLEEVIYGFISNTSGKWLYAVKYKARYGQLIGDSDDPGGISLGDVNNSYFNSFLIYSQKWFDLPHNERESFMRALPIQRVPGSEPGIEGGGSWSYEDRNYSSGAIHLGRAIARRHS
jgi:hypothetical protein